MIVTWAANTSSTAATQPAGAGRDPGGLITGAVPGARAVVSVRASALAGRGRHPDGVLPQEEAN